jgi:hypothetical protein
MSSSDSHKEDVGDSYLKNIFERLDLLANGMEEVRTRQRDTDASLFELKAEFHQGGKRERREKSEFGVPEKKPSKTADITGIVAAGLGYTSESASNITEENLDQIQAAYLVIKDSVSKTTLHPIFTMGETAPTKGESRKTAAVLRKAASYFATGLKSLEGYC